MNWICLWKVRSSTLQAHAQIVNNVTYFVIDSVTLAVAIQQRYYVKIRKLFRRKICFVVRKNELFTRKRWLNFISHSLNICMMKQVCVHFLHLCIARYSHQNPTLTVYLFCVTLFYVWNVVEELSKNKNLRKILAKDMKLDIYI